MMFLLYECQRFTPGCKYKWQSEFSSLLFSMSVLASVVESEGYERNMRKVVYLKVSYDNAVTQWFCVERGGSLPKMQRTFGGATTSGSNGSWMGDCGDGGGGGNGNAVVNPC